ncbi:formate dehydrogenase subunit alpha [Luteolibacter marinus]|uniref:formate dehydrogenase subunit alpha n=1 Tax=Luteolibacter marinus TaxID=2776705 RepID=UPI001866D4DA|nr:formate dehydrogenase subunit alpha [Luteolibacter marinus]
MTATIDGKSVAIRPGESVLEAARRLGIEVPTLCHADGLRPEGGCRMCLVRCEGRERPLAACHTTLEAGMDIETGGADLDNLRRTILGMYLECGSQSGFDAGHVRKGRFTDLLERYGLPLPLPATPGELDASHPLLRFNPQACITCRLCLEACEQVQGQFVYGVSGRGPRTRLIHGPGPAFADGPCVACGACVDLCPTGAVSDRDRVDEPRPAEKRTRTVCGFCGVGCRIEVGSAGNRVLRVKGVPEAAVNRGHLCLKGRYAHTWQNSGDRLTTPLLKDGDGFREASWDEAIGFIARRLSTIKAESGPDALGAFTSSRSTNEACYLLQKLFRSVIGTNNVDCCARVCHSSTALALQLVTGTGAASASFADIERAGCIVVAGANPTEAHPVVGARIKQAARRGVPLVVIDPRRIELAEFAGIHLQLLPGTNVALFNGIAKVLLDEGRVDGTYLEQRTEGLDELRGFLATVDLAEVAAVTGVAAGRIREAARLIGNSRPALFVHGLGLSELAQGTASVMTLCNLGMLTGSIGVPGAGMLPLRGQNNVQGSADMGSMPGHFTGYQAVGDPEARARIGRIWGKLPPEEPGLTSTLMLRAAARGELRGLWLMGEDVVQSDPNEAEVIKALERLDLVIVQDPFFCGTAKYAHVVLPAAGFLEQEGTFTNGERRIQHVVPAVTPPGGARPDWQAVMDVAARLGAGWKQASPDEVMDEIAEVAPDLFGGVSYVRLGPDGLQWPCPAPGHPGTACVHAGGFLRGKGKLVAIAHEPSPEHGVAGYPYLLVTGRLLEHYNVGTMTRRSPLAGLVSADVLEIHPSDALREGFRDGARVRVESRWGGTEVPVRHSPRIAPGTLFLSFHFPETHANRLTGPTLDPLSKCPQFKATAVRVRSPEPHDHA